MTSVRGLVLWSAGASALTCGLCLLGAWFVWPGARSAEREVVVRDPDGRVAARLLTRGKMTELVFYSATGVEVATLGVDRFSSMRQLLFREQKGELVGGWVHGLEDGAGTIYLGDNDKSARIMSGADYSDIVGAPPEGWGLQVRPGPASQVEARAVRDWQTGKWTGRVRVNGEKSSAP